MQTQPTPSAHVCTPHHAGYCLTAEFAQEVAKTAKGVEAAKAFLGFLNEFVPALGDSLQATVDAHIALAREIVHSDAGTTLPPGNLRMRDCFPNQNWTDTLTTKSQCDRVRRSFRRQYAEQFLRAPIGTWSVNETRTDVAGEAWLRADKDVYYVVDDFGFLARVDGKGGAA